MYMISFDGADLGMKALTFWFHSCWMSERLWEVCGFLSFNVLTLQLSVMANFTTARATSGALIFSHKGLVHISVKKVKKLLNIILVLIYCRVCLVPI
jgi:hypothetical protein